MEPLMLAMFRESFDDDWPDESDPRWYRLRHSGNLLIGWRSEAALPLFAELYLSEPLQEALELFEEEPAQFGPPAVPYFIRVAATPLGMDWHYGRALATGILGTIVQLYPETRDEIAAALRALLPSPETIPTVTEEDIDFMWAPVVSVLGDIQDEESEAGVLALFDADLIDDSYTDRAHYLRGLRGERPPYLPEPYDVVVDYTRQYAASEAAAQRRAAAARREAKQQRERRERPAARPAAAKVGRNEPCPCGSGKKYKQRHGRLGSQT